MTTQTIGHAENGVADDGTYLAAWALTPDDAPNLDDDGRVYIRRELADPELRRGMPGSSADALDGDIGPDRAHFNSDAADVILTANGYRRTSPWVNGMPGGQRPGRMSLRTRLVQDSGHSCTVVHDEILSPEETAVLDDAASDLIERAMAYYHSECIANGRVYQQPSSDSCSYGFGGRDFVHLVNVNGTLAVYEVNTGEFYSSSEDELDMLLSCEMGTDVR